MSTHRIFAKPTIAATLSFILPGAGLWYAGRRGMAIANLVVATLALTACWLAGSGAVIDHIHYVALVIAAASAGLAHAVAMQNSRNGERLSAG
jgi:hypothetical protein